MTLVYYRPLLEAASVWAAYSLDDDFDIVARDCPGRFDGLYLGPDVRPANIGNHAKPNRSAVAGDQRDGFEQAAQRFRGRHFSNLLETPVLFYALCIILFATGEVTRLQLVLAWLYVALRIAHSLVHVSYNRVVHRWALYVASTLCLFVMWGSFAMTLLSRSGA